MTRRFVLALMMVAAVLVGSAAPAAAHGGPGGNSAPATNYRTRIQSVAPEVPGLVARVIDAGSRIELINHTGETVTVLGYQDEPYLRVGPDGVFTNRRSPATYLNADRNATTDIPDDADPDAPPRWQRIDDGSAARFHDHRAHWMGGDDPPAVAANPSAVQVIDASWEIPLLVGDRRVTVTGDLTWIPGPSPWPWYLAAAAGVAAVAAAIRWRRAGLVLAAAMAGLLAAAAIDVVGVWSATAEPALAKVGELAAPFLCASLGITGLAQLRRHRQEALALVGASAAGFGVLFGVANLDWLRRSQLPTGIDPDLARVSITAALGLGGGITVHAALALSRVRAERPVVQQSAPATPAPEASWARRRLLLAGAGVAAVVVVAVFLFGEGSGGAPTPSVATTSAPGQVHDRLCAALSAAVDGDLDASRGTFQDRVHGPLHGLAAAAVETDRAVSARLLEAKQRVEASLAANGDSLAAGLAALAPTVRAALVAAGEPEPAACPTESPDTSESEP